MTLAGERICVFGAFVVIATSSNTILIVGGFGTAWDKWRRASNLALLRPNVTGGRTGTEARILGQIKICIQNQKCEEVYLCMIAQISRMKSELIDIGTRALTL